ncbi:DEAD/DEAH box helicase family protein [Mycoplasma sp. 613B]
MELIKPQINAINKLLERAKNSINNNFKDVVYFKAPTGSGKTFMMINFIDQLIEWNKTNIGQKIIFVITTLSNAELPKQLEDNFNEYKHYIQNKNLEVERIESPSNTKRNSRIDKNYQFFANENKVFIIGGASFRKKSILREQGSIENLLGEIKLNNYKLIYIRDEAHIGADTSKKTNKEEISFEENMQSNALFIIKMTATPDQKYSLIELSEKDLIEDDIKLLKSIKKYNDGLEQEESFLDNEKILRTACLKFKEIKKKYNDSITEPDLVGINAAMLIQVDNNSAIDTEKQKEFEQNLSLIIKILEENNLNWVKYFDQNNKESSLRLKDNYSLRDLSKNNSPVDVIIFKVGPSTGWNIPRACMLVQLRNISSNNLSIQTIGRIKRNPVPKSSLKENSIARNYYIYSNVDREDKQQKLIVLKDKFKEEEFTFGILKNINTSKELNLKEYENKIIEIISKFNDKEFLNSIDNLKSEFIKNGFIVAEAKKYGNNEIISFKIQNKIEMEIFNLRELNNNQKYLTNTIKNKLKEFFESKLKNKITKTIFWYLIIKHKLQFFIKSFNSSIEKMIQTQEIKFVLENGKKLPENFIDSLSDNQIQLKEKYAYKELNNEFINLTSDSNPETIFIKTVKNTIKNNETIGEKLIVWTKNPVYSGINFQYYNHDFEIANSFPDFLIKYENHYIYVEVKSYNSDIDDKKTKALLNAYKEYINQNQDKKIKLSLIVAKVANEGYIYFEGSSLINDLNERLSNPNNTLNLINILKA